MADSATANKRLRKQSLGSNTNTWGDTKLNEVLDAIDQCMDGYESIALTGNLTLATTNYTTADQAKYRVINFTGTAGACSVTFPSVMGWYLILNNTNGTVTVLCSGGTGVAIPAGYTALVYGDGSDLHNGAPTFLNGALTIAGALTMSGQIHGVATGTAATDAVNVSQMGAAIATAVLPATSGTVLNSVSDTTAGYLSQKVTGFGSGAASVTVSTVSPGGNECTNITVAVAALGLAYSGVLSGSQNVASNTRCLYDTTSIVGTATLPAAATVGDIICISKFGLNTLTVNFNSQLFYGVSQNPNTTVEGTTVLIYTGATRGWIEIP